MASNRPVVPAVAVPPGRILKRELEARGWTQKGLAQVLGRPQQVISELVNASKAIAPETAIELAVAFGTSAEYWLSLEAHYRAALARLRVRKSRISTIEKRKHSYEAALARKRAA